MSLLGSIASIGGMVIGGIIGGLITGGNPAGIIAGASIGGALGGLSGSLLFPEQMDMNLPPPPQPRESRLQLSTYGAAIPVVYGSGRLAGNIIYMQDVQETVVRSRHRNNGVRYYDMVKTYTATVAVAFCEGPVPGIGRIWVNGKIFADYRDPDGPYYPAGGSLYASGNLETSIDRRAAFFRIHTGAETQGPDYTLAILLTAAETPAYRGICYIVFIDFPVGEFSGVPTFEIEISDDIVYVNPTYQITENSEADYGWTSGVGGSIRSDNIGCGNSYGVPMRAFVRFQGVNIAAGYVFSEATLTLNVHAEYAGTTGVTYFEVRIEESDNATKPTTPAEFEAKSWSAAFIPAQHVYTGGVPVATTVLNLAPLLQTVIDRPGWVAGNAVQFRLTPAAGNGANDYVLWKSAYTGAARPKIEIKYW